MSQLPLVSECARRRGCTNTEQGLDECLVCPFAFACPSPGCRQPPGSPCRRPSGHNCTVHEGRVLLADEAALRDHRDRVLEQLGPDEVERWDRKVRVGT